MSDDTDDRLRALELWAWGGRERMPDRIREAVRKQDEAAAPLEGQACFTLPDDAYDRFMAEIKNPSPPNEKLKKLIREGRAMLRSGPIEVAPRSFDEALREIRQMNDRLGKIETNIIRVKGYVLAAPALTVLAVCIALFIGVVSL